VRHLISCPLQIGSIVRMITETDRRPNRYWNNKRDFEVYTIIGILRDPDAQGGWMVKAQSETGRQNSWMSVKWYMDKREADHAGS